MGYELDDEHYAGSSDSAIDVDGEEKKKERMKIVYLLPGGIMSTEVMACGKKIGEKEVVLGEGERTVAVAAWE